jgi:pyruvate/2-oxoacid:ferredoxin oxidoreductase beta subunit
MEPEYDMRDNLYPGHMACAGCGEVLGLKLVLQAVGERAIAVVLPSCLGIILGPFPCTTFKIPVFHAAFETAASSAAGISNALLAKGDEKTLVVALAGDGGTSDIGFQALSGAADRNEDIIYCCFDNEAYMNTGIQSSSSTPQRAWTMTTPAGRPQKKKNMVEIMGAHGIPYAAAACSCFPDDLRSKIGEAKRLKGMKYIHILSPCPTGWRFPERLTPNLGRLAVETRYFPLYEIHNGREYTISYYPKNLPVEQYLLAQGRFRHLTKEQLREIQKEVDNRWDALLEREGKEAAL